MMVIPNGIFYALLLKIGIIMKKCIIFTPNFIVQNMKYFLIAGEASGDLHASNLMAQIKKEDPEAEFRFFGGDLMAAVGGTMLLHYREMAFMGIFEVVANLGKVKRNMALCREAIKEYMPDLLILVDYPGFNLRMAKFAKELGLKVYYYISPKIWAWKKKRAYIVKKLIDKMFVIFPFEVDFYKQFDYKVEYVGNPLVDAMKAREKSIIPADEFRERFTLSDKPYIALVAGSRKNEIKKLLPEMLKASENFPDYQFIIAGAPGIDHDFYNKFISGYNNVKVIFDQTYSVVKNAIAAVVTSGTATLEAAFLRTPQVVIYKLQYASYLVGRMLVKINFISLVNIILNRECVKELIQTDLANRITAEVSHILTDTDYRNRMLKDYEEINTILGDGSASAQTAKIIVEDVRNA